MIPCDCVLYMDLQSCAFTSFDVNLLEGCVTPSTAFPKSCYPLLTSSYVSPLFPFIPLFEEKWINPPYRCDSCITDSIVMSFKSCSSNLDVISDKKLSHTL